MMDVLMVGLVVALSAGLIGFLHWVDKQVVEGREKK
ncbi:hypothetical protein SAMN05444162_0359 [Paenibacillaceae bacterium GAS479]|nr:hypothetical protein SAMN05444162_0359 [Paenibacillaceae bacterium GAS479]